MSTPLSKCLNFSAQTNRLCLEWKVFMTIQQKTEDGNFTVVLSKVFEYAINHVFQSFQIIVKI